MEPADVERILACLYDAHGARLYRYALVLLASPRDAEDAVQNVFVRLASHNGQLAQVRDPLAYLVRSVRNEAMTCLRRQRRFAKRETSAVDLVTAAEPPLEDDRRRSLRQALIRLPPQQREAVALHSFEGLTFAEIGAALNESPHTIASRYRLGVSRLARWLRDE